MPVVAVDHISKRFGDHIAVDDVSFTLEGGEIFGLLGPNGAGKTTSIRIMLDLFKPDQGRVSLWGGPMTEAKKDRLGYLPEERGLYQDIQLEACLVYLATLKGLKNPEARRRVAEYLERFDLCEYRKKKVETLSKGMQQKAQLITTLIHKPDLIIIDEPFSALDPINTQVVKDLLRQERDRGAAVVMCTHQMNQVEALCDRIVLINQGKVMVYGPLRDVQRQYAGRAVRVISPCDLSGFPGVAHLTRLNGLVEIELAGDLHPQEFLRSLVQGDIPIERFEIATPSLDEIFIQVVQGTQAPHA